MSARLSDVWALRLLAHGVQAEAAQGAFKELEAEGGSRGGERAGRVSKGAARRARLRLRHRSAAHRSPCGARCRSQGGLRRPAGGREAAGGGAWPVPAPARPPRLESATSSANASVASSRSRSASASPDVGSGTRPASVSADAAPPPPALGDSPVAGAGDAQHRAGAGAGGRPARSGAAAQPRRVGAAERIARPAQEPPASSCAGEAVLQSQRFCLRWPQHNGEFGRVPIRTPVVSCLLHVFLPLRLAATCRLRTACRPPRCSRPG